MNNNMDDNFTCAGIILTSGDYLLVVQGTKTDKWSFPKGHREENEDVYTTATREMFEETSIKLNKSDMYCATYRYKYKYDKDTVNNYVYLVYKTHRRVEPAISDTDEIKDAKWVHIGTLLDCRYDKNRSLKEYVDSQVSRKAKQNCGYGKNCRNKPCLYKH